MPLTNPAPGWPGIPPRWTSSAKSGVGTALSLGSRVWFNSREASFAVVATSSPPVRIFFP